ncbi:MAG: hypothetical protein K5945_07990 [Bacteroidaceae bacterium]|nr:hypothetical protein [Bacteroidaceae bacterium]
MKQLLVLLFLLCSTSVFAQDVIVKKDGSTIVCRVVEVSATEITYKKWSDLNGSNYVMDKSLASAINYENGKKVNLSEVENQYLPGNQNGGIQQYNDRVLVEIDAAIQKPIKKAKKLRNIGWIGGGVLIATSAAIGIIAGCENTLFAGGDSREVDIPFIATLAGGVVWTTSFLLASNHTKKKIDSQLYNTSIMQYDFPFSNSSSLSLGANLLRDNVNGKNTLGFNLRYNF